MIQAIAFMGEIFTFQGQSDELEAYRLVGGFVKKPIARLANLENIADLRYAVRTRGARNASVDLHSVDQNISETVKSSTKKGDPCGPPFKTRRLKEVL